LDVGRGNGDKGEFGFEKGIEFYLLGGWGGVEVMVCWGICDY
jgi:hypothetical protein